MKNLFRIESAAHAHLWLLAFASTRSILDDFWVPAYSTWEYWVLSYFNTLVYLYTLYLQIPAVAVFLLGKMYSRKADLGAVLQGSVLIWAVYPAVTLISMLGNSPPNRSIEWFRYIPTFLVERNFLPLGMIIVVPVLISAYVILIKRHSQAGWFQTLIAVLVSLLIVYLLYYQYTFRWFFIFSDLYGPFFSYGYYTLCFLVAVFLLEKQFRLAFGSDPVNLRRLVIVFAVVSLGLMAYGVASRA
jgi:hypothetical protein